MEWSPATAPVDPPALDPKVRDAGSDRAWVIDAGGQPDVPKGEGRPLVVEQVDQHPLKLWGTAPGPGRGGGRRHQARQRGVR